MEMQLRRIRIPGHVHVVQEEIVGKCLGVHILDEHEFCPHKAEDMRHTGLSVVARACSMGSWRVSRVMPVSCSTQALYTPRTKSEVGRATCSGLTE